MTVAFTLSSGSTFDSAALTSATDWSFNESGSPTSFTSDGHRLVDLVTVDAIQATVSVNCTDTSLSLFKKVGSKGSLVLKSKLRTGGDAVSTEKTYTFANAVLTGTSPNVPNDGSSSISFNFSCYSTDGTTTAVYAIS